MNVGGLLVRRSDKPDHRSQGGPPSIGKLSSEAMNSLCCAFATIVVVIMVLNCSMHLAPGFRCVVVSVPGLNDVVMRA